VLYISDMVWQSLKVELDELVVIIERPWAAPSELIKEIVYHNDMLQMLDQDNVNLQNDSGFISICSGLSLSCLYS
jgi:hypothetical protein